MRANTYHSPPIPLPATSSLKGVSRAQFEFHGVDLAGPSFEARVFLNNPAAGPHTPTTPENGYVGSFHVYGYGMSSFGDLLTPGSPSPQARVPTVRTVDATAMLRRATDGGPVQVSVVPVFPGATAAEPDLGDVLGIQSVSVRTTE
jgi:hypothetical protein